MGRCWFVFILISSASLLHTKFGSCHHFLWSSKMNTHFMGVVLISRAKSNIWPQQVVSETFVSDGGSASLMFLETPPPFITPRGECPNILNPSTGSSVDPWVLVLHIWTPPPYLVGSLIYYPLDMHFRT
jgi:hypothetical protein